MTALETIGSLLAGLKQISPTVLLAIATASGAVIFGGDRLAGPLGIIELRDEYRPHLGAAFLGTSALLLAYGLASAGKSITRKRRQRQLMSLRRKSLHTLTPDEKAYLGPYVLEDENTQYFQLEDGVVGGLAAKNILYQASGVARLLSGLAYNMQPWAKEYLAQNPHLLEGANPDPEGPPGL